MGLFGKTYSREEKEEIGGDIDKQIGSYLAKQGSIKDMVSDAASDPSREGVLGRGGKLRNEVLGLRKKKSKKPKTKRCKCKK
jgi:hypothetical protein